MLAPEDGTGLGHDLLDERVTDAGPHRHAAVLADHLGHGLGADQVVHDRLAGCRSRIALATIAVVVEPETGSPRSSTRNTRSASPSNARPMSAPSRARPCADRRGSRPGSGRPGGSGRCRRAPGRGPTGRTGDPRRPRGPRARPSRSRCRPRPSAAAAPPRSTNDWTCAAKSASRSWRSTRPCASSPLEQARGDRRLDLDQPGLLADRRGAGPAELDAVVLRRVVAGREHRSRRVEPPRREVAHVGRRESDVGHVGTGEGHALDERGRERHRRRPHVVTHDHPLSAGEGDERVPDPLGDRRRSRRGRCPGCRRP